jgi:3-dehydroquinate synthase
MKSESKKILSMRSSEILYAISKSCEIKADIVEADEHETKGLREKLNLGHTIGHALESETNYKRYSHGEAIAIGMLSACLIGEKLGVTKREITKKVSTTLEQAGFKLKIEPERNIETIISLLMHDKKSVGGEARFVLPEKIGSVSSGHKVGTDIIREVLLEQRQWNSSIA